MKKGDQFSHFGHISLFGIKQISMKQKSFNNKNFEFQQMVEPDGAWLRPATRLERLFEVANRRGYFLPCYHVTLSSAEKIISEQFVEAFERLFRLVNFYLI